MLTYIFALIDGTLSPRERQREKERESKNWRVGYSVGDFFRIELSL